MIDIDCDTIEALRAENLAPRTALYAMIKDSNRAERAHAAVPLTDDELPPPSGRGSDVCR
jgi:hypothetical protein